MAEGNGTGVRAASAQPAEGYAERWRGVAAGVRDVASLQRAGQQVRAELRGLDLAATVEALGALAEESHALARFVQADLDAARLHTDAGESPPDEPLSVCPPEVGSVRATRDDAGSWRLTGTQRRSAHPAAVASVLVVAATPDGDRLFRVATAASGVHLAATPLSVIAPEDPNGPVTFAAAPAVPVGTAAWWAGRSPRFDDLVRDAACWWGACRWLERGIATVVAERTGRADAADLTLVGRADVWVTSAEAALRAAVPDVERDPTSVAAELAARRAVAVAATTVDTVIRMVALLSDARVSRADAFLPSRVAQLQIALRRFDAEANVRAIGARLAGPPRAG